MKDRDRKKDTEEIENHKSQSTGRDARGGERKADRTGGGSDQLLEENPNRSCRHGRWDCFCWGPRGGGLSGIKGGCVQVNVDTTWKQIWKGLGCVWMSFAKSHDRGSGIRLTPREHGTSQPRHLPASQPCRCKPEGMAVSHRAAGGLRFMMCAKC